MAWGRARWGGSLWGYRQTGIPLIATVLGSAAADMLTQRIPTAQEVAGRVLISGAEIAEAVSLTLRRGRDGRYAQLSPLLIAGNARPPIGAPISVSLKYILSDGSAFERGIFSGLVSSARGYEGGTSVSTEVRAAEAEKEALDAVPANSSWNGTASALIAAELEAAGITNASVQIDDFTINGSFSFNTVGQLIGRVLEESGGGDFFTRPDGIFAVLGKQYGFELSWEIPLAGLTKSSPEESSASRFNRITVQGTDGSTATYDDLEDQVEFRVLKHSGYTSAFTADSGALLTIGERICAASQLQRMVYTMPANPFFAPGDIIRIRKSDDSAFDRVKLTGKTTSFAWPGGAWEEIWGVILP